MSDEELAPLLVPAKAGPQQIRDTFQQYGVCVVTDVIGDEVGPESPGFAEAKDKPRQRAPHTEGSDSPATFSDSVPARPISGWCSSPSMDCSSTHGEMAAVSQISIWVDLSLWQKRGHISLVGLFSGP